MFLKRSMSAQLVAALGALLIVGGGALTTIQTVMFETFFEEESSHILEEKTMLLTAQMAGGVKWGKVASIEKTYEMFATPESNAGLSDVLVTGADLAEIVRREGGTSSVVG